MEIICTKTGSNKSITAGNTYEVLNETENRYTLINDKGVQKNYCKSLFSFIEEETSQPVPIRTLDEILLNIEVSQDLDIYRINLSYTDNLNLQNQDLNIINTSLNIHNSNISCGIHQLSGLNNLFSNINSFLNSINNFYRRQNLSEDIRLEVNLNDLPTKSDILTEILSQITEQFESGLVLLSTNINNNRDICDEYIDALNELSVATTTTLNPNSGNNITLWTLNCNE